jgi:NAD(P)H-dependent FMN reductase
MEPMGGTGKRLATTTKKLKELLEGIRRSSPEHVIYALESAEETKPGLVELIDWLPDQRQALSEAIQAQIEPLLARARGGDLVAAKAVMQSFNSRLLADANPTDVFTAAMAAADNTAKGIAGRLIQAARAGDNASLKALIDWLVQEGFTGDGGRTLVVAYAEVLPDDVTQGELRVLMDRYDANAQMLGLPPLVARFKI